MHHPILLFGTLACAALAGPSAARATPVQVSLSGTIPTVNNFFAGGTSVYTTFQTDYLYSISATDTFSFTFTYDPAATHTRNSGGFNYFPATLVSGSVGPVTDFSAFTPEVGLSAGSHQQMLLVLNHVETLSSNIYTSFAAFTLVDNGTALFTSIDVLPNFDFEPILEQRNASFGIDGSTTTGYRYAYFVAPSIVSVSLESGGTGVPEPSTAVLFAAGLLGLAGLRRRYSAASA